jgi:hypothetical protein
LIPRSLWVELFSVLRLDSIVDELRCYFSPLDWGYDSVAKYLPTCLGHWAWLPDLLRARKTSWSLLSIGHFWTTFNIEASLLCVLGASVGCREGAL